MGTRVELLSKRPSARIQSCLIWSKFIATDKIHHCCCRDFSQLHLLSQGLCLPYASCGSGNGKRNCTSRSCCCHNTVLVTCASFQMSRLSRANIKARESIFASGPEQYIGDIQARCPPDLEECVLAMEDCCEEVLPPLPFLCFTIHGL